MKRVECRIKSSNVAKLMVPITICASRSVGSGKEVNWSGERIMWLLLPLEDDFNKFT